MTLYPPHSPAPPPGEHRTFFRTKLPGSELGPSGQSVKVVAPPLGLVLPEQEGPIPINDSESRERLRLASTDSLAVQWSPNQRTLSEIR